MSNTESIRARETTKEDEVFAYTGSIKKEYSALQHNINQSEQKETTEDPELRKLTELFLNVLGGDISKKDALIQQIIKTYCSFHGIKEKDFPKGIKSDLEENFNSPSLGREKSISLRALLENNGNPTIIFHKMNRTTAGRIHYSNNTIHLDIPSGDIDQLINNIIKETSHAKQVKMQGSGDFTINTIRDFLKYGDKKRYKKPGTLEYEAHTIIEPQLQREYSLNIFSQCKDKKISEEDIRKLLYSFSSLEHANLDQTSSEYDKNYIDMQKRFFNVFKEFYESNKNNIDIARHSNLIEIFHDFDSVYIKKIRTENLQKYGASYMNCDIIVDQLGRSSLKNTITAIDILLGYQSNCIADTYNPFLDKDTVKKATDYLWKNKAIIEKYNKNTIISSRHNHSSEFIKAILKNYGLGRLFE